MRLVNQYAQDNGIVLRLHAGLELICLTTIVVLVSMGVVKNFIIAYFTQIGVVRPVQTRRGSVSMRA
jgi:hypothetical protein